MEKQTFRIYVYDFLLEAQRKVKDLYVDLLCFFTLDQGAFMKQVIYSADEHMNVLEQKHLIDLIEMFLSQGVLHQEIFFGKVNMFEEVLKEEDVMKYLDKISDKMEGPSK